MVGLAVTDVVIATEPVILAVSESLGVIDAVTLEEPVGLMDSVTLDDLVELTEIDTLTELVELIDPVGLEEPEELKEVDTLEELVELIDTVGLKEPVALMDPVTLDDLDSVGEGDDEDDEGIRPYEIEKIGSPFAFGAMGTAVGKTIARVEFCGIESPVPEKSRYCH